MRTITNSARIPTGVVAAAALALLISAMTAHAESMAGATTEAGSLLVAVPVPDGAFDRVVPYDGLDLKSAEDVKTLAGRIKVAAHDVCRRQNGRGLEQVLDGRKCRDVAFAHGMAQLQTVIRKVPLGVEDSA